MKRRVTQRRPLSWGEWLLVGSPVLIVLLLAGWQWWRRVPGQRTLLSPTLMFNAWGAAEGRVIGMTGSASQTPEELGAEFLTWNSHTDEPKRGLVQDFKAISAAVSPDGGYIAVAARPPGRSYRSVQEGASAIEIHDVAHDFARVQRWLPAEGTADIYQLQWVSPRELLVMTPQNALLYDVQTGTLQRTYPVGRWLPGGAYDKLRVSPDGRWAAVLEGDQALPPSLVPAPNWDVSYTQYHNTCELGQSARKMLVVSWPRGAVQKRLAGDLWYAPSWTPQGELLAVSPLVAGQDIMRLDVARFNPQSRQTARVTLQEVPTALNSTSCKLMSFSPDGRFLVSWYSLAGYIVWDAATGKRLALSDERSSKEGPRYVESSAPTFSLDSRFLLRPRSDGVEMVDLDLLSP